MTNAVGAVTLNRRYDAWGNLEVGASEPGYAFTGREWDSETGLYYYRARYYDSAQGRFISEDPLGLETGDSNFYPYAGNQPVVNVDPSGLAGCLYDISSHSLECRSTRTGKTITIPPSATKSGSGSCQDNPDCVDDSFRGPVVPGVYRMNRDARPEHRAGKWWRLEAIPPVTGWEYYTGQKRSGMAMHAGTRSIGFININKNDPSAMRDYNTLNEMLLSEEGSNFMGVMK